MSEREHINENGEFQSDKYPSCPAGKVPLSTKDKSAQDLLWYYAQRRRAIDSAFADDLEFALTKNGYVPSPSDTESNLLSLVMDRLVDTPSWLFEVRAAATEALALISSLRTKLAAAEAEVEKLRLERSSWKNTNVLEKNTELARSNSKLARCVECFRQNARKLADKWEQESNEVDPILQASQPISTRVRQHVSSNHATELRVLISEGLPS